METKTSTSKHIDFEDFIEATTGAVLRALQAHGMSSELNPQPLPPAERAELNPQPLPPGRAGLLQVSQCNGMAPSSWA